MRKLTALIGSALVGIGLIACTATASGTSNLAWCTNHADMAVLGDSESTGYSTTGYTAAANNQYQDTRYGWSSIIARNFHSWYGTSTQNYSHGGAQVSDYLPGGTWPVTTGAVTDISVKKPGLVFIMLGTNDQAWGVTPDTFKANLEQLVRNIRAVDSPAAIFIIRPPEADFNGTTGQHNPVYAWSQYDFVGTVQALNTGYIDTDMTMPPIPTDLGSSTPSGLYSPTTGHPNDAGDISIASLTLGAMFTIC